MLSEETRRAPRLTADPGRATPSDRTVRLRATPLDRTVRLRATTLDRTVRLRATTLDRTVRLRVTTLDRTVGLRATTWTELRDCAATTLGRTVRHLFGRPESDPGLLCLVPVVPETSAPPTGRVPTARESGSRVRARTRLRGTVSKAPRFHARLVSDVSR